MLSRLTLLQISLVGGFVLLFVAGIMFFAIIRPKQQQLTDVRAAAAASKSDHGVDTDVAQEQAVLKKAQADKVTTVAEWQEAAATYMPSFPFTDDVLTTYPKIAKIPGEYSAFITNWYDAQRKFGIARLAGTDFQIPAFPSDPNFVSDLKNLTLPSSAGPWQVQVEAKTFDDAIDHLRRFNNEILHHGMPVVDGVMLSGESPHLLVSYSLALYIILGNTPPKADERIGNGPTGGGAGGTLGGAGFGKGGVGGLPGRMGGGGGFGRPMGGAGGFGRPMGGAGGRRANK